VISRTPPGGPAAGVPAAGGPGAGAVPSGTTPGWVKAVGVPLAVVIALFALGGAVTAAFLADSVSAHHVTVQEVDVASPTSVTVIADADDIQIVPGGTGKVVLEQAAEARAPTRAMAQQAAASPPIPVSFTGGQVTIDDRSQRRKAAPHSHRLKVQVPADARLVVRTTRGDVAVVGTSGDIDIAVQAGDVRLDGTTVTGETRARATFGDVEYSGVLRHGSLDLQAINGSVRADLPLSTNAHLEASAADGDVEIDPAWPVVPARLPDHPPAAHASGDLGTGADGTVTLGVGVGDVRLAVR
jgi:hypothetical protein